MISHLSGQNGTYDPKPSLRVLNLTHKAQYLSILKQARTVKDTLEVSEKLSGVRGEIEQQQAEFETLSRQADTVAISVSLHAEAQAKVFGVFPKRHLSTSAEQNVFFADGNHCDVLPIMRRSRGKNEEAHY